MNFSSNGRTIRTLVHERERPSDTGSGGLAARPILDRNLMYGRRPDPAEVFHISVLALLMLFPLHRLVDRRTSLNADYSEISSISVQTPERSLDSKICFGNGPNELQESWSGLLTNRRSLQRETACMDFQYGPVLGRLFRNETFCERRLSLREM